MLWKRCSNPMKDLAKGGVTKARISVHMLAQ